MKPHCFVSVICVFLFAAGVGAAAPVQQKPVLVRPGVIRVASQDEAGNLVRWVTPVYPPAAKQARIQGKVVLSALIDREGRVEELQYVSGPPLLVQAALYAVRHWEYMPILFNGTPVKVETTVEVIFSLRGPGKAKPEIPTASAQPPGSPPQSGQPGVIRVDGQVQAAKLVHRVTPVYPPEAKHEGIFGTVVLSALIGTDGRVEELLYVSGPMPLVKSAMDAVRQWQYKPTLVKGAPVSVETTITVIYSLGRDRRPA